MTPSQLERIVQSDFGVGSQPDIARHLIDQRGAYKITNGLLDDDGLVYRRGGTTYKTAAFGAVGLRWIWDGYVAAGRRTIFANTADFGVLGGDDTTIVNLGGDGRNEPFSAVEVEGMLFIAGPTSGNSYIYAGSQKAANYSTGTVSVTNGTKTVTGVGTTWNTLTDAGMLLQFGDERVYPVASIESTTSLTLRDNYEGTTKSGSAYTLYPLYQIRTADPYEASEMYAVSGNRLIRASDNRVFFAGINLTTGVSTPHSWGANDYHRLADGVQMIDIRSIGDSLLALTTGGIWNITGMQYGIVDPSGNPQHRLDNINREIVAWGRAGVAPWANALIVPALDGIYLIDPVSGPTNLSLAIESRYRRYVDTGYKPGQATAFHNHYCLPILNSSNETVEIAVCRLDRPVSVRGQMGFPWTWLTGYGAKVSALARRRVSGSTADDQLLGANNTSNARILRLDSFFEPDASVKADADGSDHTLEIQTRNYVSGSLNLNRVRRLRVTYEMQDAGSDDPKLYLDYATCEGTAIGTNWGQADWGEFNWGSSSEAEWTQVLRPRPSAPEDEGGCDPWTWHVDKRVREVRFRLRSSGPAAKLRIRHLELFVAPSQQIRR